MPISIKRLVRVNSKGKLRWADVGYCASQKAYFFGYTIHALVTRKSIEDFPFYLFFLFREPCLSPLNDWTILGVN
jgi:hypothetical protein